MFSIVAVRAVPQYRAYFRRWVAQGKPKMDILVAVGRKLLSTFYAILKRGGTLQPQLGGELPFCPGKELTSIY